MSLQLFSTQRGDGHPRVAFLHGLLGQGKNWATVANVLGDQGPALLLDLPNHGRSDWTPDLSYPALADQIATELQQHLDPSGRIAIVGHSMGGKVAMALALRHPELVRGLVVVDIAPDDSREGYGFDDLLAALRHLDLAAVTSRAHADAVLAPSIPDSGTRAFLLQNLRQTPAGWSWRPNLTLLAERLPTISGWPADLRGSYSGPTLWLRGERSDYVRTEHRPLIRELFPRALVVTIKDAGHWVHADNPTDVTTTIVRFLSSLRDG
ncbi:MAG: alpha/beta fold hydrolase [Propioniciclava sp.]